MRPGIATSTTSGVIRPDSRSLKEVTRSGSVHLSKSMVPGSSCLMVRLMVGLSPSNRKTSSFLSKVSLLICRLLGCFVFLRCQPADHVSFFLLSFSLCSRSTSLSGTEWSSCHEYSLWLMICHSLSDNKSAMLTISAPIFR